MFMSRCPCLGRRSKGFSLIELLVVVAVIALLTGLALPGYQAYLQRARRTDAREALLRGAQWLERVASIHGQYPEAAAYPAARARRAVPRVIACVARTGCASRPRGRQR